MGYWRVVEAECELTEREKVHKRVEPKDLVVVNRKPGESESDHCRGRQILKINKFRTVEYE